MIEFKEWPKTPRLFRDMIVTEKIDGTNAAIIIEEHDGSGDSNATLVAPSDRTQYVVGAQSRKRLITPKDDNFGFARWVFDNADDLVHALGPGRHYGEWWGSGIQRGYGLQNGEKRFSLFNVKRYADMFSMVPNLGTVPVLFEGPFDLDDVTSWLETLRTTGSLAAPGFMNPEGVVVFHAASGAVYKATLDNDGIPKGLANAA